MVHLVRQGRKVLVFTIYPWVQLYIPLPLPPLLSSANPPSELGTICCTYGIGFRLMLAYHGQEKHNVAMADINNPSSPCKVLITLYIVGRTGLNL